MLKRTMLSTSGCSRFVGPECDFVPQKGRVRRTVALLHMAEITAEDIEETLILSETGHVAGGPLATGRYIR